MKNLSSIMAVVVNMELLDKLRNFWYIVIFIINCIICVIGIIRDFKKNGSLKLEDWAYIVKFGEDLKKYYEKRSKAD